MLQYLLNATAIWLLSLLMYDILLRKESFHNYNRFYLLFTFLLGALFPLVQVENYGMLYSDTNTVQQVASVKQNIIAATASKSESVDLQKSIWLLYLSGVAVSGFMLIIELTKLLRLYTRSKRYTDGIFTIVETNKPHAPFSIVNLLFVCSREQYSADEWQIVTVHEGIHSILYHFFDLLLMQAARVVFWFHPLVYVYNKRLLMVHEYQADKTPSQKAEVYGHFLVEQALLSSAPSISHSFNRSPIKDRIVMLTRNSSRAARTKMLVFIPLLLTCLVCFAQNAMSYKKERRGDIVTYRGNKFELSKQRPGDTVYVENPATGQMDMRVTTMSQHPIKMNGAEIIDIEEVSTKPEPAIKEKTLREYLQNRLQNELSQLPAGRYRLAIDYIVVDANGHIAYYDFDGIETARNGTATKPGTIDDKLAKRINEKTEKLLVDLKITPAKYKGKNVPCLTNAGKVFDCSTAIEVKDNRATWLDHY